MSDQLAGLPHRYPFLLLDRIIELRPGDGAVAMRNLGHDDPLLGGDGALPAVLLAETMAQCAGLAVLAARPGGSAVVARIDRFRVRRAPVGAGDQLQVSVRITRAFGPIVKTRGVVRCNGRLCAAGEVVLQVSSGPPRDTAS